MKIKLSKNQWEFIGKKTGWMRTAQSLLLDIKIPSKLLSKLNTFPEVGTGFTRGTLVLNDGRRITGCGLSFKDGRILSVNNLPAFTNRNLDFDVENIIDIEMIN